MSECRNCGRNDLHNLGHIGKVFPFFLKRVLGMELRVPRSSHALKQKVRDLVALSMGILRLPNLHMRRCNCASIVRLSKRRFRFMMTMSRDFTSIIDPLRTTDSESGTNLSMRRLLQPLVRIKLRCK